MNYPMNRDGSAAELDEKFGGPVHVGTHGY
jgi:hypothetical protein